MQKVYTRINWKNYPSNDTPLNESNLNRMDAALNEIDNRVITLDNTKLSQATGNTLLKDVSVNNDTGVITLTALNGTTKTLNTNLGKIAVNFSYDQETQRLVLVLQDGNVVYIDLSALIQNNEFDNTSTIGFTVSSGGHVSANVLDGSINERHLRPDYLADIRVSEQNAQNYSNLAEGYKDEAYTYMGQTEEYKTDTNYYMQMTETYKDDAQECLREISDRVGASSFSVNFDTGNLEYTNDAYYTFTINTTTGELEWEVV